jgi:hypothetical protein
MLTLTYIILCTVVVDILKISMRFFNDNNQIFKLRLFPNHFSEYVKSIAVTVYNSLHPNEFKYML